MSLELLNSFRRKRKGKRKKRIEGKAKSDFEYLLRINKDQRRRKRKGKRKEQTDGTHVTDFFFLH